jgi:acetylornithine deacetylase/succinyl-diaminopimelate desuccinylase-like protein
LGKNPIPEAIRLIEAITNWEPKYQQKYSHSFMKPLIGLGALEAGFPYKPSVCPPPSCSLYLDIRTLPGTKPVEILRELEDVVNQCKPRCEVEV